MSESQRSILALLHVEAEPPGALEPTLRDEGIVLDKRLAGDAFDLPDGAALLASSSAYPHQAFRIGSGLGLQFHVEATAEMTLEWMKNTDREGPWRSTPEQIAKTPTAAECMKPLVISLARRFAEAVRASS